MSSHSMRLGSLREHRETVRPNPFGEAWTTVKAMIRARRTRRLLRAMDDHLLADIGIGRGDALMESSRPMWDLR